jgi:hypothetical protein
VKLTPINIRDAQSGEMLRVVFRLDHQKVDRVFQAQFLELMKELGTDKIHQAIFSGRPEFGTTALPDYSIKEVYRVTPEVHNGHRETVRPFPPKRVDL